MTAKKFSQLDPLEILTGTEEVPVAHQGRNFKFQISKIKSLVTKSDVGLDQVNNTPDLEKPVSTAMHTALNGKANNNHGHGISDVSGLAQVLLAKSDTGHHHPVEEIDGLQLSLDGKSNTGHGHPLSELNEVQIALNNKANASHAHNAGDITGLSNLLAAKADTTHMHNASDIADLVPVVQQIVIDSGGTGGDVSVNNIEW